MCLLFLGDQAPSWAVCFHSGPRLVVLLWNMDSWVSCRLAQNQEGLRDVEGSDCGGFGSFSRTNLSMSNLLSGFLYLRAIYFCV